MTDVALIYGSTFMAVFFLGLQSLNVNQGQYLAAAVTSFFISTGHIFLYRLMPDSGTWQLVAYYAGGVTGITASIWCHPRLKAFWSGKKTSWLDPLREARLEQERRRASHSDTH